MKYSKGFWICAYTDVIERLAYMIGHSLILIFATVPVVNGGLGVSEAKGAMLHSFLTGFVYIGPLLGGVVADRLVGARYTTPIGMIIVGFGYWCGSCAKDETLVYVMIFCVSIGLGLFKNGSIIGKLIKDKAKIDSAFSIRYTLVNLGALIGSLAAGILYKDVFAQNGILGFSACFRLAAILMFAGSVFFIWGTQFMGDTGKRPFKEEKTDEELLLEQKNPSPKGKLSSLEKTRLYAILLASGFSIIFWICWYLSYLPVYYYWSEKLNWKIWGYEIPLTWFDSTYSLFCIILGPIVTVFWNKLSTRSAGDLNLFQKTSLGLLIIGVGYIYLIALDNICKSGYVMPALCLIPIALILALGEMVFSPLGHAFITKYAPSGYLSTIMSLWGVSNFIASLLYGPLYLRLFNGGLSFKIACIVIAGCATLAAFILIKYNKKLVRLVEKG